MVGSEKKKKKVSKRNKRAWRKTDVQDVEDFLEEKRSDQRLGVDKLGSKKNEELFVLDTEISKPFEGKPRSRAEKKAWAKEPSRYQLSLIPTSAIEDPIKRNRVKTKDERKHPARKAKDIELEAKGLMRCKAMEAKNNKIKAIKKNMKQRVKEKTIKFDCDVWKEDEKPSFDDSWLGPDAKRQALMGFKEFKVKPPKSLSLPRSQLPKVEIPHAGLSYNPSLADHKELISVVVEKELEMSKKDAHIDRVTAPFKVKRKVREDEWADEVLASLGIPRKEDGTEIKQEEEEVNETEETEDSKGNIVKKAQPKMKTKKQRRIQNRLKNEALQKKQVAVEKRKTSDIYQLKRIVNELDEDSSRKDQERANKQEAKSEYTRVGTKRLARLKYEEPLQDFTSSWDLRGSLRKIKSKSTILRDRFFSLQKRNMLQPCNKILKKRKRSVKVVVKRDHRIDEEITKKSKSSNKLKIINTG